MTNRRAFFRATVGVIAGVLGVSKETALQPAQYNGLDEASLRELEAAYRGVRDALAQPLTLTTRVEGCDTCGAPATTAAVDVMEWSGGDGWMKSAPVGRRKFGCDRHPAQSRTFGG